jgi:DNA-binding transcriptional LysR family regulator
LQSGKLVEVLSHETLVTHTSIWAIYPSNRAVPPKVRVMLDFLLGHFSPVPPWEQVTQAEEDKPSQ